MYPRLIQQPHHEEMQQQNQNHGGGSVEPFLDLTSDPKPRLRWTADLHDRFVDAVNQLGGPNSEMESENCSSSKMNTPSESQDKDILKPEVGMTFNSFEEGEMFYKKYAKEMGFVVRRHTTRLDKETRDKIYQSLVCSKEGLPGTKAPRQDGQPQRKRAIIKEDCMACMKLQKNDDGKWFVKKFEERHSHAFVTPTKRHFLVRNREVIDAHRNLMNTFREANLRTSQVMSVLETTKGDYSDIGCSERENLHTKPRMLTSCEMEIQMSTIYTRAKFSVFQDELHRSLNYATNILHLDGHRRIYMVKQFRGIDKERAFEVKYRGHDELAICGCKKFECEGIPCRHILVVLRNEFLTTLPPQYILKRWTLSATSDVVVDDTGVELGDKYGKKQNLTIMRMTSDFRAIVTMIKDSEELEEMGEQLLSDARKEIEEACGYSMESRTRSVSLPSTIEILPLEISKTKGSGKHLKGDKEKIIETTSKPPRLCRRCKKLTHHDSRNCPLKFSSSSANEDE